TQKGGVEIDTFILKDKKKGPLIRLDIRDTGIGMSTEFLPHVFDSFRQESQGINRKFEGSSLGLSITKKYLKLLNGDIKVQSEKGKGSTFSLFLPLREG